ncbi:hypothetical protein IFT68_15880 [Oxalobacteraceae sp. CFBP 13730]|nr:hypothetical protein [Oxalobacteraceae sp. CFBP 13730]
MVIPTAADIPRTHNDIDIGVRLVDALRHHAGAAKGTPVTYNDLLRLARLLHPKDLILDRAVGVGIGAKLRFVEAFCAAHDYPNLASLAVGPTTMRPPAQYGGDWDADRRAVAAFDWSIIDTQLADYARAARAAVSARLKPRKERPADVSWYAYFCSHRKECAWIGKEHKQEIVNLIMAGIDPDTAMKRVQVARTEFGEAA